MLLLVEIESGVSNKIKPHGRSLAAYYIARAHMGGGAVRAARTGLDVVNYPFPVADPVMGS
jgi:hypothetical protein